MASFSRSNPLALAVLCCLLERPMHPYEVSQTLRERAKDESIRLNFGSLYAVVDRLEAKHLIRARETVRAGRRPERTIYEITDIGRQEMTDWLTNLIMEPAKEYPQFEAGLTLMPALAPDEAKAALQRRIVALEMRLTQSRAMREQAQRMGLPRLFDLEGEYAEAMLVAELQFVRSLVAEIDKEALGGLAEWRSWHAGALDDVRWFPSDEGDDARQ